MRSLRYVFLSPLPPIPLSLLPACFAAPPFFFFHILEDSETYHLSEPSADAFSQHIAALSPDDYGTYANPNNSPVCGKQIRIHGSNGQSVVAKVVDRCAGCTGHNVDVTPAVFLELGYSESVGRVEMSWEYL